MGDETIVTKLCGKLLRKNKKLLCNSEADFEHSRKSVGDATCLPHIHEIFVTVCDESAISTHSPLCQTPNAPVTQGHFFARGGQLSLQGPPHTTYDWYRKNYFLATGVLTGISHKKLF